MDNKKPNILWIFSDQHAAHALSCYGSKNVETPNLDRLAREGMLFKRAYSNCPLCSPFRASLYTGKNIYSHGVVSLDIPLIRKDKVLPEILQENGYHTSHMGKWHLCGGAAPDVYVSEYFRPGWNEWLGWENSNRPFDTYYITSKYRNKRFHLEGYQTDGITDLTIQWLKEQPKDRPWFHVMSIEPPHDPNIAPDLYMNIYKDREILLRPNVPETKFENSIQRQRGYYAQVKNLDDNIGRVVSALEASGQIDNTIIFHFSDHGDLLGSHGMNQKGRPEEESSNIPFIVRYPKAVPQGIVSDALISAVDFAPTLLGMLGIEVPVFMEGRNLADTLFNENSIGADYVLIHYEHTFFNEQPERVFRTLVTPDWKYTLFPNTGEELLYNLSCDPYEMDNKAHCAAFENIKIDLKEKLFKYNEKLNTPF